MVLKDAVLPNRSLQELMGLKSSGVDEIGLRLQAKKSFRQKRGWFALFKNFYAAYRTSPGQLSRSKAELTLVKEMVISLYNSEVTRENWEQAISQWMALCAQQHRCTLPLAEAIIHEATMRTEVCAYAMCMYVHVCACMCTCTCTCHAMHMHMRMRLNAARQDMVHEESPDALGKMLCDDTTGFRRLLELKSLLDGAEGSDELLAAQVPVPTPVTMPHAQARAQAHAHVHGMSKHMCMRIRRAPRGAAQEGRRVAPGLVLCAHEVR